MACTNRAAVRLLCPIAAALLTLAWGCGREEEPPPAAAGPAQPPARVETELKYVLDKTFDSGMEQLNGVAVDAAGRIYLVGSGGVRVIDWQGNELKSFRTAAAAQCAAPDADGNVYIALRTKVEKYGSGGELLASWGKEGGGRGEFKFITSITVAGTNVYVADAGNRCVHRFDFTGDFIDEIGKRDGEAGIVGLICPGPHLDCQVDAEGLLHVNNPGLLRVERYSRDGELLDFWGKAGLEPERFCGCCNPTDIALMGKGRTVTSEKGILRVKVYDSEGKMLAFIGPEFFSRNAAGPDLHVDSGGGTHDHPVLCQSPGLDLAVDSRGRIYVADPDDRKVRVFKLADAGVEVEAPARAQ